jgi:hypothetical protein
MASNSRARPQRLLHLPARGGPDVDAEGEVSSQSGHLRPFYPIPPLIHCAAAVYYRRRPGPCEAMYLSCL